MQNPHATAVTRFSTAALLGMARRRHRLQLRHACRRRAVHGHHRGRRRAGHRADRRELRSGPAGADPPEPARRPDDLAGRLRAGVRHARCRHGRLSRRRRRTRCGGLLRRAAPGGGAGRVSPGGPPGQLSHGVRAAGRGAQEWALLAEECAHHRLVGRRRRWCRRRGEGQEGRAGRSRDRRRRGHHLGSGHAPAGSRRGWRPRSRAAASRRRHHQGRARPAVSLR